jgi:hypothetical protein
MPQQPARQTFGLKNAKAQPREPARRSGASKGVDIHPAVLGGGVAFVIAVAAVLMLGGGDPQPAVIQAGQPRIMEVSGGSQTVRPTTPAPQQPQPQQQQGGGGKFGAANSALGSIGR